MGHRFYKTHDRDYRKRETQVRALWMLVKFLLMLAIVVVGAMFAMENNQLVDVDFILLQSATMSLGLWLMIFLAVGCLLGLLASSVLITYYKRQLARALKKD
jgi:putative membrane protein